MRIDIITIFPEYFAPLAVSLIGKAAQRGEISFGVHDLRAWTHDVHHAVDDAPFGGGPGMIMKPEPWGEALDAVLPAAGPGRLVIPSPAGVPFTQATAVQYAAQDRLTFACGRYEGIDARVAQDARSRVAVDEVSIGDYVLAGAEAAVLVMIEAVCRLLPGVIGNADSTADDSFGDGTSTASSRGLRTPGPGSGAATRCRPSCCPATTRLSRGGAVMLRSALPRRTARTSRPGWPQAAPGRCPWPGRRLRRSSTRVTGRCCPRLAFRSVTKMWHTDSRCPTRETQSAGA